MRTLQADYFDWMCRLVYDRKYCRGKKYNKLLRFLNDTDFFYILEMDENRAEDGISMRYKYGDEYYISEDEIYIHLSNKPCSILEMMVALSIRCENHIMDDPEIGNRTGEWFWNMIDNLGLSEMSDDSYDADYVEMVVQRFLNREYQFDGEGGLFTVRSINIDMRKIDIWYQMCWYLNSVLSERRN